MDNNHNIRIYTLVLLELCIYNNPIFRLFKSNNKFRYLLVYIIHYCNVRQLYSVFVIKKVFKNSVYRNYIIYIDIY